MTTKQELLEGWYNVGRMGEELLAKLPTDSPYREGVKKILSGAAKAIAALDEQADEHTVVG